MEQKLQYPKADKYPDLYMVYKDCCGPGGLKAADAVAAVGFDVLESGEAPDGYLWWWEFTEYDDYFVADPDNPEAAIIKQDGGRWITYGYVIARKPEKEEIT